MNILIENYDTLEYLTVAGQWTKDPLEGRCFPITTAAVQVARREPIGKFNIVCHIPKTDQMINLDHGRGKGLPDASATTAVEVAPELEPSS